MLCGGRCCANASQPKREQEVQKQDVLNLTTGGDPRLATVKGGRRTLERRQQRAAHEGLYDAPEHWGYNNAQQESLLPGNLYEATPDHSILKNGLAKSLSRVDIADIAVSAPPLRVRMANQSSRRRTPGSSRQTPVSRKARARKSQQDPHQVQTPSIHHNPRKRIRHRTHLLFAMVKQALFDNCLSNLLRVFPHWQLT